MTEHQFLKKLKEMGFEERYRYPGMIQHSLSVNDLRINVVNMGYEYSIDNTNYILEVCRGPKAARLSEGREPWNQPSFASILAVINDIVSGSKKNNVDLGATN